MNWIGLNKKRKMYILGFGALAGVLLWAFISAGVITHNFNRSQLRGSSDSQEAKINGVILTETKDDVKYWEIYGEKGDYDNKDNVAMLNNVVGNFYKDNEVTMSFESTYGVYNAARRQIILFEDTFVVLQDGLTLKADRLVWSGSDKPITAEGHVEVTRGNEFLARAQSIEISPDYSAFKIKGDAVSKIYKEK
jgi:LPS export ABC transporter protein LptC